MWSVGCDDLGFDEESVNTWCEWGVSDDCVVRGSWCDDVGRGT